MTPPEPENMTGIPLPSTAARLSVLIPLGFDRGHAEACLRAWCLLQTAPAEVFEVVALVPDHFPAVALDGLRRILRPHDRVIVLPFAHDVPLVEAGAHEACADILLFTESHVIPGAEVVARALASLDAHPEWAAFSVDTKRVTKNRLGEVEADMYEHDIREGLLHHPWRKILDQCFVTRRAPYEACGGFDGTLGHFAEWVLAARYFEAGHAIGYAPDVELTHHYIGELAAIEELTDDFCSGEARHIARDPTERGETVIAGPREWSCRGNLRADASRHLLAVAFRAAPTMSPALRSALDVLARRALVAVFGAAPSRTAARTGARLTRLLVALGVALCVGLGDRFGSKELLRSLFNRHISAVAHARRIACAADALATEGPPLSGDTWTVRNPDSGRLCGFHDLETFGDVPFRWSEPIAVVDLVFPAGRHGIAVETLAGPMGTTCKVPRFYIDGRAVDSVVSQTTAGIIVHRLRVAIAAERRVRVSWVVRRTSGPRGARARGLPVVAIWAEPGPSLAQ